MMKRWRKIMKMFNLCMILCLAAGYSPKETADSNLPRDGGNTDAGKIRTLSLDKEPALRQGWEDLEAVNCSWSEEIEIYPDYSE